MSDKVMVIIGTSDVDKAKTGVTYCMRTLQEGWLEDAQLIFFGPGEQVLLESEDIQNMVKQIATANTPMACKAISDQKGTSEKIKELGVDVVYVGKIISDNIKAGYVPMVW